jgi:hypothetical protein
METKVTTFNQDLTAKQGKREKQKGKMQNKANFRNGKLALRQ